MKKIIVMLYAVLVFPFAVSAYSIGEDDNYLKVKDKYSKADEELSSIYKSKMREYKREGAGFYGQNESRDVYLKRSQQAWIKLRDADCDYETYESKTGTAFSSIYEKCLLDKTSERIKYLNEND
ncbi:TPA: lysozyme inhibitor LprI family protein [Serratia rubidaea]